MTVRKHPEVKRRKIEFAQRTVTRIWDEEPAPQNPYVAAKCRCHGYDLLDLARKCSFVETLFLLFQGELPTKAQAALFETLLIGCINPGPRHPGTRAAMNAGIGRTKAVHILPISLSVLGGTHLGGEEVEAAMRFLRQNMKRNPEEVATDLLGSNSPPKEGDWHIAPGFGSRFGGIDPMPQKIAAICYEMAADGQALQWAKGFTSAINDHGMGWLITGTAAAVFCDLGFHPRAGGGLFQLACAPGLLAHGLEMSNKPITAMPFLDEDHYVIEPEARKRT